MSGLRNIHCSRQPDQPNDAARELDVGLRHHRRAASTNTNGVSVAYTPNTATNSVPTTITPSGVSSLATTLGYTAAQTVNSDRSWCCLERPTPECRETVRRRAQAF